MPPLPVHLIPQLEQPADVPISKAVSVGESYFCTSIAPISGTVDGYRSDYRDINAFALGFVALPHKQINKGASLSIYGVDGTKKGALLQSARYGVLKSRHSLQQADCISIGICLEASITTLEKLDIKPRESIKLFFDGTPVYLGRLRNEPVIGRTDEHRHTYTYNLEGWKAYAADIYANEAEYTAIELSDAIRDLYQQLAAATPITYNASKIENVGYELKDVKVAYGTKLITVINKLQKMAGAWVWGVDVHGELYFKSREVVARHHFWLNKHAVIANIEKNSSEIQNSIIMEYKPENGPVKRRTVESAASIAQYGKVEHILPVDQDPQSTQPLPAIAGKVSSNKTIIDVANLDVDFKYMRIDPIVNDDYIEIDMTGADPDSRVDRIEITQGHRGFFNGNHQRGAINHLQVVAQPSGDVVADVLRSDQYDLYYLPFTTTRSGDDAYRIIAKASPVELLGDWIESANLGFYTSSTPVTSANNDTSGTIEFTPNYDIKLYSVDWYIQDTQAAPNDHHTMEINGTSVTIQTAGQAGLKTFDFGGMLLTGGTTYTITFTRDFNLPWRLVTIDSTNDDTHTIGGGATIGGVTESLNIGIYNMKVDINVGRVKGWEVDRINIPISTQESNDALRYAMNYLDVYAWPYIEGNIKLPAGIFYRPAPVRLIDYKGGTHIIQVDRMVYELNKGLQVSAGVGNRQLYLERLLAGEQ